MELTKDSGHIGVACHSAYNTDGFGMHVLELKRDLARVTFSCEEVVNVVGIVDEPFWGVSSLRNVDRAHCTLDERLSLRREIELLTRSHGEREGLHDD